MGDVRDLLAYSSAIWFIHITGVSPYWCDFICIHWVFDFNLFMLWYIWIYMLYDGFMGLGNLFSCNFSISWTTDWLSMWIIYCVRIPVVSSLLMNWKVNSRSPYTSALYAEQAIECEWHFPTPIYISSFILVAMHIAVRETKV